MNAIVLLYVVISLIWIVILILVTQIFASSLFSIAVSVLFLIVYIPLAYYYISKGEEAKLQESLFFTILLLIGYAVLQSAEAIRFLRASTHTTC